jgi:hypothetical protein
VRKIGKENLMHQPKTRISLAVALALAATGAFAADAEHDQHHPGASPPAAVATLPPSTPGTPMAGMPAGSGTMPMTGMMQMMMNQNGMASHVEGRIAFLKAELKITDAQQPLWNPVADAIRANAKSMADMPHGMAMMSGGSCTLPEKLVAREKALSAHLDGIRTLRTAFDPLYAALSTDQKKTADNLMIGPMGIMGMGMM